MTYQVCEADSIKRLHEQVNHLLRKGWRLQGGIAVVNSQSTAAWWYYQALVHPGAEGHQTDDPDLA